MSLLRTQQLIGYVSMLLMLVTGLVLIVVISRFDVLWLVTRYVFPVAELSLVYVSFTLILMFGILFCYVYYRRQKV